MTEQPNTSDKKNGWNRRDTLKILGISALAGGATYGAGTYIASTVKPSNTATGEAINNPSLEKKEEIWQANASHAEITPVAEQPQTPLPTTETVELAGSEYDKPENLPEDTTPGLGEQPKNIDWNSIKPLTLRISEVGFNANLQFNADKRAIEFRFGSPKQSQGQQQDSRKAENQEKRQGVRIPKKLLGREVSPEEQAKLKESGTVYMEGLKDRQGQPFNAYVRANFEKDKFDFFKWNPDKSQTKEVVPDNASKTQVAVNSEGKTNEATKHVKEPLKEGQTQPTAGQKEEKQEQKRSKGMKM